MENTLIGRTDLMFRKFCKKDLPDVHSLQPEGWADIETDFKFYIETEFCFPIKVEIDNTLVGVGASICYKKSSWLAHIIVSPDFRNKGIGTDIVNTLLAQLGTENSQSVFLCATELGLPVYKKIGFKEVSEYIILKHDGLIPAQAKNECIVPYSSKYKTSLLVMDEIVTRENRANIMEPYLDNAVLFVKNGSLQGYYIPDLGEGPVISISKRAGMELLREKFSRSRKLSIPIENCEAIEFAKLNGYVESGSAKRMVLGELRNWQPRNIYSRMGPNFG